MPRTQATTRYAVLLLLVVSLLAIGESLLPGRAFVSVHSALRPPLDTPSDRDDFQRLLKSTNIDTGDQLFQVLPERRAFNEALVRGELPLWWPEAGGGISLLGAPGAELLEPRALLLSLIFGPVQSLAIQAALTIFILGILTFWWLKHSDFSDLASVTGAVAFALCGALSCNLYYICKVDSMILLPGGLLAIELWIRGRTKTAVAVMALAAAESSLASFPQNTAVCLYAVLLCGGFRMVEWKRSAGGAFPVRGMVFLFGAMLAGLAVGAIHYLPVREWSAEAARTTSLGGAGFRASPANWLSMFVPLVVGDPVSEASVVSNPLIWILDSLQTPGRGYNFTETTIYSGLMAIPLMAAGLACGTAAVAPATGLLFTLAIAMGTPVALLPGVNVSAPARALAGAGFFVAWLCALGMDALLTKKRAAVGFAAGAAVLLVAGFAAAFLAKIPAGQPAAVADLALRCWTDMAAASGTSAPDPRVLDGFEKRHSEVLPLLVLFSTWAFVNVLGVGAVLLAPRARVVIFVMMAADLIYFAHHILPAKPSHNMLVRTPAVEQIRTSAEGGRVLRIASSGAPVTRDFELFQTTLPSYFDISDTAAYVIFPNANQVNVARAFFKESVLYDTFLGAAPAAALDSPLPDVLGASIIFTKDPLDRRDLELIVTKPGFHAYKRRNWRGRAWIAREGRMIDGDQAMLEALTNPAFTPTTTALLEGEPGGLPLSGQGGGTLQITEPDSRTVKIKIKGSGGGFLVEAAPACAGWSATLDGFSTPLFRANRCGRAVYVPPGDHEVVFTYFPPSFLHGSIVTILSIAVIVLLIRRAPVWNDSAVPS